MEPDNSDLNIEDLNFKEFNLKKSMSSPPPGLVNNIFFK